MRYARGLFMLSVILFGGITAVTPSDSMAQVPGGSTGPVPADTSGMPFKVDVNNLTATAVLALYAWYVTTKIIPDLMEKHRGEMKEQRDQFMSQIATLQTTTHQDATTMAGALAELAKSVGILQATLSSNH